MTKPTPPAGAASIDTSQLPDNAYKPLAAGESCVPVVPAPADLKESTWRAVL